MISDLINDGFKLLSALRFVAQLERICYVLKKTLSIKNLGKITTDCRLKMVDMGETGQSLVTANLQFLDGGQLCVSPLAFDSL